MFNQPLSFDTSSVTNMAHMFQCQRGKPVYFNQPLSFDTSSVTDMSWMFWVCSARALPPSLQSVPALHAACAASTPHPATS